MSDLQTEKSNSKSRNIDLMETIEIVETINKEDMKVAKAVKKALPEIAKAVDMMAHTLLKGGRIAYFGAGTSGRLGVVDASEMFPTFGLKPEIISGFIAGGKDALLSAVENAEDKADFALKDINTFNPTAKDIVIGISANGGPTYILKVLEEAKKRGATTIGITQNPKAKLASLCDMCIIAVVGAEVITGSSRMKAGTAQKMILNMLSTGAMIKIGKTYGNYMVDLQMSNQKLIDRGNRMIATICKISIAKANEYRIQSENNVKTACVMCLKNCNKKEAEKLLAQHHGVLRKVICNEEKS